MYIAAIFGGQDIVASRSVPDLTMGQMIENEVIIRFQRPLILRWLHSCLTTRPRLLQIVCPNTHKPIPACGSILEKWRHNFNFTIHVFKDDHGRLTCVVLNEAIFRITFVSGVWTIEEDGTSVCRLVVPTSFLSYALLMPESDVQAYADHIERIIVRVSTEKKALARFCWMAFHNHNNIGHCFQNDLAGICGLVNNFFVPCQHPIIDKDEDIIYIKSRWDYFGYGLLLEKEGYRVVYYNDVMTVQEDCIYLNFQDSVLTEDTFRNLRLEIPRIRPDTPIILSGGRRVDDDTKYCLMHVRTGSRPIMDMSEVYNEAIRIILEETDWIVIISGWVISPYESVGYPHNIGEAERAFFDGLPQSDRVLWHDRPTGDKILQLVCNARVMIAPAGSNIINFGLPTQTPSILLDTLPFSRDVARLHFESFNQNLYFVQCERRDNDSFYTDPSTVSSLLQDIIRASA